MTDLLARKQELTEYPGQEHFYATGGAAVRMRTAGKQKMTVARLGVEDGCLFLMACPLQTIDVPEDRFAAYNQAWPIIALSDQVMGRKWPGNHLGFVYTDRIPHLIEIAERMNLGYTTWDPSGREYTRPS